MYKVATLKTNTFTEDVIDLLIEASKDFSHECDWSDVSKLRELVLRLIETDTGEIFIAYTDEGVIGVLLGSVGYTNILKSRTLTATELLWWVHEDHRKSKAGLMLYKAFDKWSSEVAEDIVMGISYNNYDERVEKFLIKKGFIPTEKTFIRKAK